MSLKSQIHEFAGHKSMRLTFGSIDRSLLFYSARGQTCLENTQQRRRQQLEKAMRAKEEELETSRVVEISLFAGETHEGRENRGDRQPFLNAGAYKLFEVYD
jgi:hypothetical protein